MDRTERLLDLVALLLDAREPISWAEIRDAFPEDYGASSDEAAERKFERDKAELLELGIPLQYVQGDDDRRDGYVVDRDSYYLPDPKLTPEELAVLYAAGSAALASGAFPGKQDLAHALRKIRFSAKDELPSLSVRMEVEETQLSPELPQHLEALWSAAANRKFVELTYRSPKRAEVTRRRVDPYGLSLRRGVWTLVGYCHLRKGIRSFLVHRVRDLKVNAAKPRSTDFEVPADFRIDDYVAQYPWQHRFHPKIEVELRLTGQLAPLAARAFPDARIEETPAGTRAVVDASYLDGLLRHALSLGEECRVIAPADAVERSRAMANRILERHAPVVAKASA